LPPGVYGKGQNIRDWLYVLDHCKGTETVAGNLNNPNWWENIRSGSYRLERQGVDASANSGSA
jgi:hypothetical protein